MGSLLASLTPFALGTLFSPLAVIAMIAVLLSHRPGPNGSGFLAGWVVAVLAVLLVSLAIAGSFSVHHPSDPPRWVPVVRLVIGTVLIASGAWMLARGHRRVKAMAVARGPGELADAAPQLPGWLKSVENFTPWRCVLLGFALCAVNPVDLSCIVGAGLDLRLSQVPAVAKVTAGLLFVIVSVLPAAAPFALYAVKRAAATPTLKRLRSWIAAHNGTLTAVMVFAIGILQLVKGIAEL